MKKYTYLTIVLFLVLTNTYSQSKLSIGSGDWNNPSIWSPTGVPLATDNVIIQSNHVVDITSNQACNSLTIGTGSNAELRFSNGFFSLGAGRSFTVNSNLVIGNSAAFSIYSGINTHSLVVKGDIINNGTVDFRGSASLFPLSISRADIYFLKNGNQNLSGTGILTRFNDMTLNMGTSVNNVLNITTTSFDVASDFLNLINGTFQFSTPSAITITPYTALQTIATSCGFWLNSSASTVNMSAGININGHLTVTTGNLNIGDANDENMLYNGGTFNFDGGVTTIAGRYSGTAVGSNCNFNMKGGIINLSSFGSTNTTFAPFQISSAGSNFSMSGGTIVLRREGGTGTQDLGYINLAGSGSVTDGTLQIGSVTGNQIMKINSTALIPNLLINNATATASLITNSINVVKNVTLNSGTLNANNLNITLGGNWQNNGGTFTTGNGLVTFNSTTAQSIFKSGGEIFNQLTFNGAGVKTFSAPVTAKANFVINNGSNVNVGALNHQLTLRANFTNNGTFGTNSGLVLLNGTTSQNIGGSSITNFYNLTLNNSAGAILSGAENLINTLTLTNGTFNTNSQVFTLISTAANSGRIAQIPASANILGNVTVQRFAPGGTTGWALIGTPISTALTLNDWDDDIAISCPTCPDGSASSFLSIYTYNEAAAGTYSDPISYVPLNTINDPIISNKGYWVYLGDGFTTTNNITLDVTGNVRKFNQTIPLSVTNNASVSDIGWNLIHNPYPSPISWAALKGATANIDDAIYVYNADLNGGNGGNATYVNGISSPAVGSGGIGDVIPICQAFYVHSTGATALNATEAIKVSGNPTFLKSSSTQNAKLVRLNMKGPNGFNDESVLYTQSGALPGFDEQYDAIKMAGQDPYAPFIAFENGNTIYQINAISPIAGTFTTDLKVLTGYTGSYTISASEINGFPVGACFKLFDKFTSITTDLNTSDHVFNLVDTTTIARFVLSISIDPLQISSQINQPSCENINGGLVVAKGLSAGPWNYYWKDANDNLVQTSLNKNSADTLMNLWEGDFKLDVTTVGQCDNNQSMYQVIKKVPVYADFVCADTCYLSESPVVQFNNTSLNSSNQSWNFGDNSGTSTLVSPNYQYANLGVYSVKLIAVSATGCKDTIVKNVMVMEKPVGIKTNLLTESGMKIKTLGDGKFLIDQDLKVASDVDYSVHDAAGKLIMSEKLKQTNHINLNVDLDNYEAGIYILNIQVNKDSSVVIKLPVQK